MVRQETIKDKEIELLERPVSERDLLERVVRENCLERVALD